MKTLRLFGMTFIMVLVTSCFTACSNSSDDDDDGGNSTSYISSSIVGTWLVAHVYAPYNQDIAAVDFDMAEAYTDGAMRVTFNQDGTFLEEFYKNSKGWYMPTSSISYGKNENFRVELLHNGIYEVNNNKLLLQNKNKAALLEINSFNNNKMVVTYNIKGKDNDNVELTLPFKYTLKRLQ